MTATTEKDRQTSDWIRLAVVTLVIALAVAYWAKTPRIYAPTPIPAQPASPAQNQLEARTEGPVTPSISLKVPHHLTYPEIVEQLKRWNEEAPHLTSLSVYGQSSKGADLYCLRISSRRGDSPKAPVLVIGCLHGNEPLATGALMAYFGTLLGDYGRDGEATSIIDTREIHFVPVVSPDSYTRSREVDGVDPNRNFPTPKDPQRQSVAPVMAVRKLFHTVRPRAVLSGHTFGRLFMIPYGDRYGRTPNEGDYERIVGEMATLARYKKIHCSELYDRPISGTECDYFYRSGAMTVVAEFGDHQRAPSYDEIQDEHKRTKEAINLFLVKAPEVPVTVASEEPDFSRNTGIAPSPPRPGQEPRVRSTPD